MISRKSSDRKKQFMYECPDGKTGAGMDPQEEKICEGSGELFPLVEQQYEITIRAIREYEAALSQNPAE